MKKIWRGKETHLYPKKTYVPSNTRSFFAEGYTSGDDEDMTLKRDPFICKKRYTHPQIHTGAGGGLHVAWWWRYEVEKRPIYMQKEIYLPSNTHRFWGKATRWMMMKIWRWKLWRISGEWVRGSCLQVSFHIYIGFFWCIGNSLHYHLDGFLMSA